MPTEKQFDRFLDVMEDIASSLQELIVNTGPTITTVGIDRAVTIEEPERVKLKKETKKKKKEIVKDLTEDEDEDEDSGEDDEDEQVEETKKVKKPKKEKKVKELTANDVKTSVRKFLNTGKTKKEAVAILKENFGTSKTAELTSDQIVEAVEIFNEAAEAAAA